MTSISNVTEITWFSGAVTAEFEKGDLDSGYGHPVVMVIKTPFGGTLNGMHTGEWSCADAKREFSDDERPTLKVTCADKFQTVDRQPIQVHFGVVWRRAALGLAAGELPLKFLKNVLAMPRPLRGTLCGPTQVKRCVIG
jgi:hypothetical protein